jgi:hypothetical protein
MTARVLARLLVVTLVATVAIQAAGERRITSASNVRLRHAPATNGSVAAELPLGADLIVLERAHAGDLWYRVKTDEGRNGWVLGRLTAPLDPERRDRTIESILLDRLPNLPQPSGGRSRIGQSFSARVQLFDLIERTAAPLADREVQARFALYRLRAMGHVLAAIPFGGGEREPYRGWIDAHEDAVTYNELAGRWMVGDSYIKHAHETHRGTAAADDIAWFLAQNGLRGECEGDVPCYVDSTNQLDGAYLRLHPAGRHADESTGNVARVLNGAMDNLEAFPLVLKEFNPASRCDELHASLDPLVAAVMASASVHKADAFTALNRYSRLCR